jgi:L-threonylcarbamoyladenylate synthase
VIAAVEALARGFVVAAPTESFFGLLADAGNPSAVAELIRIKARSEKGAPILLPNRESWAALVREIPPAARLLADAFWPGPLTIALPKSAVIDDRLGLDGTIAVRLPGPSLASELVQRYGRPLTATSANLTGQPPATTAEAVRQSFPSLLVVGETAPGGAPSSVVVVRGDIVEVAREGAIDKQRISSVLAGAI